MNMLVGALVTFVVVLLVLFLIDRLPLDGRTRNMLRIVVIVLGVISLLRYLSIF